MSEQNTGGFFSSASPKLTFVFGLVAGLAIVSFVGFIILLIGNMRGKGNAEAPQDAKFAQVVSPPTQAPVPEEPEERVGTFSPIDVKTDHVRGDANAKVTILEYSDTECPFCKKFHETMRQALDEYKGKVNWVYRHFPLRQLHSQAAKEAEATECAAALGGNDAFWKYLDRLFVVTPSNDGLDLGELPKIAAFIGLDQKQFETCLASGKYAETVRAQENDAVNAGGRGTPYSVIIAGDQKIPLSGAVPLSEIQQILSQVVQ